MQQTPPPHVVTANPWIVNAKGVNPADYGAASKAVASQGEESMDAEAFTADDDGFNEGQAFLGRQRGDEPPEEFEEEPF